MKPLNLDNSPCTPTSSKCIIWQGEDIPCINLCKGDTISDVTYKLATELCTVLDTLNVSNYDLSCFNINACGPDDFKALIQFLIDRICELENVEAPASTTTTTSGADCPTECLLTAAECFGGGTVNLVDYVNQIADKICDLVTGIDINKSDINNLEIRVSTLESTPAPTFTIPSFILDCDVAALSSGVSYQIDVILEAFINDVWCSYQAVLGTSGEIAASIVPACSFGTDVTTDPNWTASPSTLAESLTNVWIVLCELYNNPKTTVVAAADDITVSSATVGNTTTYTVGRTPKLYGYNESLTDIDLVSDPNFLDSVYFIPAGGSYNSLTFTNTTGGTADFLVKASFDSITEYQATGSFAQAAITSWVDAAITKNNNPASIEYQVEGVTSIGAYLVDSVTNTIITTATAETVVTTPSGNAVETTVGATAKIPRNASFFKVVTLNAGESVQLMFKSKSGQNSKLLQAQLYVEEIR